MKLTLEEFTDDKAYMLKELRSVKLHKSIHSYNIKVVKSGKVYEVYKYQNRRFKGYSGLNTTGRLGKGSADKDTNRDKVLYRARRDIRNIVNTNFKEGSKFLTLTFKENVTDIDTANNEFKCFIDRVNYHIFKTKKRALKYTVVPETQKRGAIHFHVVCYNLPYVEASRLADIWGNGFIKINKIDHVDNVGAYICKYLSKEECESFRGKKCYFNSRNLDKPIEITQEKRVTQVLQHLDNLNPKICKSYHNEYTGEVGYRQYIQVD